MSPRTSASLNALGALVLMTALNFNAQDHIVTAITIGTWVICMVLIQLSRLYKP
jgi:hypothetical protein